MCRPGELRVAAEPSRADPLPGEILRWLPGLSGAGVAGGSAAGSRQAVSGGGAAAQPLRGDGGGLPGAEREGLWAQADGGHRALRQIQGVLEALPDYTRQAALLRTPGLRPLRARPERRVNDHLHAHGGAPKVLPTSGN